MGILRDSSIVIAGVIISNVLGYIFHIYAGRVLGPVDYGVFGALMALFSIIALPAGAISSAITKFVTKFNSNKEYNKIGILRKKVLKKTLGYSLILLTIITFFSSTISNFLRIDSVVPVILIGFTLIFAMILPVNLGVLQGMKKFKAFSINTIIEAGSRLVLVSIFLFLGLRVSGSILAYGLGYLIAFFSVFPFIKETKITQKEDVSPKGLFRFIFLILLVNLILQVMINTPTVIIKHFFSSEFTGYWVSSLNIARITLFISTGIVFVMFPSIAEKENHRDKKKVFKKVLSLTLVISTCIAAVFFLIPKICITLLYGKEFLGAAPILQWMGIAMIGLSVLQLSLNFWVAKRN